MGNVIEAKTGDNVSCVSSVTYLTFLYLKEIWNYTTVSIELRHNT